MDRDPGEGWQHPAGVDRVLTPARSQVVDGQRVGAGHMDPPQLGSDPPAGLVEVCHVRGGQVATSRGQETLEPLRCGGQQRGQPASGDRGAEAVGHRLGRPVDRQVLTTQQVGAQRGHPGPVTRGGRGLGRERRGGHRPTRTGSPLGPVLGHLQLDRWQVEHLPDLLAHDRRVAQVITAGPARPRGVDHDLVRFGSRLQGEPLSSGLLSRLTARRATKRPRRRLHERIRARRLRRVLRVLRHPRFQLRYPGGQLKDPRGQLHDQPVPLDKGRVTLGKHRPQPGDLRSMNLIRHGHPTSITSHKPRSTQARRSAT